MGVADGPGLTLPRPAGGGTYVPRASSTTVGGSAPAPRRGVIDRDVSPSPPRACATWLPKLSVLVDDGGSMRGSVAGVVLMTMRVMNGGQKRMMHLPRGGQRHKARGGAAFADDACDGSASLEDHGEGGRCQKGAEDHLGPSRQQKDPEGQDVVDGVGGVVPAVGGQRGSQQVVLGAGQRSRRSAGLEYP